MYAFKSNDIEKVDLLIQLVMSVISIKVSQKGGSRRKFIYYYTGTRTVHAPIYT